MDNRNVYPVDLTVAEMRAVVKSLSIGIDQLMRKTERVSGIRKAEIMDEIVLLSSAKLSIEEVMIDQISN